MIAGKFEEIYPPLPNHYIILTDNAYYIEELFHMEREVLKSLNYKISGPTVLDFLSRFGSLMQYED